MIFPLRFQIPSTTCQWTNSSDSKQWIMCHISEPVINNCLCIYVGVTYILHWYRTVKSSQYKKKWQKPDFFSAVNNARYLPAQTPPKALRTSRSSWYTVLLFITLLSSIMFYICPFLSGHINLGHAQQCILHQTNGLSCRILFP